MEQQNERVSRHELHPGDPLLLRESSETRTVQRGFRSCFDPLLQRRLNRLSRNRTDAEKNHAERRARDPETGRPHVYSLFVNSRTPATRTPTSLCLRTRSASVVQATVEWPHVERLVKHAPHDLDEPRFDGLILDVVTSCGHGSLKQQLYDHRTARVPTQIKSPGLNLPTMGISDPQGSRPSASRSRCPREGPRLAAPDDHVLEISWWKEQRSAANSRAVEASLRLIRR
jgi:hypothetical protein